MITVIKVWCHSLEVTLSVGIFSLFVTDKIRDKVITKANKYALNCIADQNINVLKRKSRLLL